MSYYLASICIILSLSLQIPESVRYLMTGNEVEKAEEILNKAINQNKVRG